MKKIFSFLMCIFMSVSFFCFEPAALSYTVGNKEIGSFLYGSEDTDFYTPNDTRASGLIYSCSLGLSKNGTTLHISGETGCAADVVRCGFKNLTVERRKTSSDSWKDYYEYGNVYLDTFFASLSTDLTVEAGYQYRVTCKHYAKKSLLVTQTYSNTSNIVTVS